MTAVQALFDMIVALPEDFEFFGDAFDYGDLAEPISAAFKEITKSETPDYLSQVGILTYALAELATTREQRAAVYSISAQWVETLVEFHLSENAIYLED